MTLYNSDMKNEKIAIIALGLIIFGALSVFLAATYSEEILNNLFPEEKTIEFGDCADVNYIGTLTDGTIFDSSYIYPDNKTQGTPLKIFITMNKSEMPPTEYSAYSSGLIDGFLKGLVGLKEGETATIGPIPPEDAYGANKLKIGDVFSTITLAIGVNFDVEVTEYTEENLMVKWINLENFDDFTSPQAIINDFSKLETDQSAAIYIPPPGLIWENATSINTINEDTVEVIINPTKSENIVENMMPIYSQNDMTTPSYYICPNATTATWTDSTITLQTSPEIGDIFSYTQVMYGTEYTTIFTVVNLTDDKINFSLAPDDEEVSELEVTYVETDKTMTFNRTYTINRYYEIPLMYVNYFYAEDIENAGYSTHELAGEELTFEVTVEEVYKTSQES